MTLQLVCVLMLTLVVFTDAYPYNDVVLDEARYSDSCCQLEWKNITKGQRLPADYVVAGSFMNRNWSYILSYQTETESDKKLEFGFQIFGPRKAEEVRNRFSLVLKSDQASENINWLGSIASSGPYPVLTNPNNCHIDWLSTRFFGEELPQNDDWCFPVINDKQKGDFARTFDGKPAFFDRRPVQNGLSFGFFGVGGPNFPISLKYPMDLHRLAVDVSSNYQLMYVDCKKSILTMSKAKLFNITYDQAAFKKLQSSPGLVQYKKITKINNSPEPMKTGVKFEIETTDQASLTLKESHSKFFSTRSQSDSDYEKTIKIEPSLRIKWFSAGGAGRTTVNRNRKSEANESSTTDNNGQEIYNLRVTREKFEFSQDMVIPAYSKSIFVAFSKPVQGNIPFTAVYELFPTGSKESNTAKVLEATLKKYGMDQKTVRTNRGTLLVEYEGSMHVDAGHEIDVDVQTTKLGNAPKKLFL